MHDRLRELVINIWSRRTSVIASFAVAAILLYLILRFGLHMHQAEIPLLATLALGGTPLVYELLRRLFRREFGSAVRFLAVMVIATPCPLLIAIPVAIIGSISLSARRGIIIKSPVVLEQIGACRTAIFDKTGTLAEAAGVVVMESSLKKVDEFIHISRRMRTIALQSAVGGMVVSIAGMLLAASGHRLALKGPVTESRRTLSHAECRG